jgi:histidyl-tRNA synthetase
VQELRRAGFAADVDYAGRSVKGQLTQASRTGATTIVRVTREGAFVRDEAVSLDGLAARLRP